MTKSIAELWPGDAARAARRARKGRFLFGRLPQTAEEQPRPK
jgi:hypothetical protein